MPLSLQHRHAVLLADRTRDVRTITTLRTAAGQAYLVANRTTADFEMLLVCRPGTLRSLMPA